MRVLWFSNTQGLYKPVNIGSDSGYNGGGWMSSVQKEIMKRKDIILAVSFCMNGEPKKVVQDNVCYYPVSNHTKKLKDKILDIVHYKDERRGVVAALHWAFQACDRRFQT